MGSCFLGLYIFRDSFRFAKFLMCMFCLFLRRISFLVCAKNNYLGVTFETFCTYVSIAIFFKFAVLGTLKKIVDTDLLTDMLRPLCMHSANG
jgi:hypothetical protein